MNLLIHCKKICNILQISKALTEMIKEAAAEFYGLGIAGLILENVENLDLNDFTNPSSL